MKLFEQNETIQSLQTGNDNLTVRECVAYGLISKGEIELGFSLFLANSDPVRIGHGLHAMLPAYSSLSDDHKAALIEIVLEACL